MSAINKIVINDAVEKLIAKDHGDDCIFAGTVFLEFGDAWRASAPDLDSRTKAIQSVMDDLFGHVDWARSFSSPIIIMLDEVMYPEILPMMHFWLRKKSANIENVYMYANSNPGISQWWNDWCTLYRQKSFKIDEVFYTSSPAYYNKWFSKLPKVDPLEYKKTFSYYFSFYGGSHPSPRKQHLFLTMAQFADNAFVDMLDKKFDSRETTYQTLEYGTYFKNQAFVESLLEQYDQHVSHGELTQNLHSSTIPSKFDEPILTGLQWAVDRQSFATVVRETYPTDCYNCLTEKTLRGFLHYQAVVPTGHLGAERLEKLGFWFPHEIIDYSYQQYPTYLERFEKLASSLQLLINTYSLNDLQEFYHDNYKHFESNANLIYDSLTDPFLLRGNT